MTQRPWVVALVLWTFLVWTTRIANIWNDVQLTTGEKWGRTGLAGSFTVLAVVAVVALVRRATWLRAATGVLSGWTTVVWIVRATRIATADHEVAFTVVHVVLAVLSITLAALAWRQVDRDRTAARPAPG